MTIPVESLEFNLSSTAAVKILSNVVELNALESLKVHAVVVPFDAKFLLFAAHHQQDQITMSYNTSHARRQKGSYVTGRDVGLVVLLEDQNVTDASVWLSNESNQESEVLVSVSWYLSTGKQR